MMTDVRVNILHVHEQLTRIKALWALWLVVQAILDLEIAEADAAWEPTTAWIRSPHSNPWSAEFCCLTSRCKLSADAVERAKASWAGIASVLVDASNDRLFEDPLEERRRFQMVDKR